MTAKIDKLVFFLVCIITISLYTITIFTLKEIYVRYSLFTLASVISIIISLKLKNISTLIFNILLYLGFFFKISLIVIIEQNYGRDIYFGEALTLINFNSDLFQNILTKLIFFYLFFSISEILLSKLFTIYFTKKDKLKNNQVEGFIVNNKKYLVFFILTLVILINIINLLFGITYRGKIFEFSYIELLFKTFNFFLSLSLICIIADIDYKKGSKYSTIILILLIFTCNFNHYTLLSRSGIFELIIIFYIVSKTEFKKGIILLILSSVIWIVLVKQVNDNRENIKKNIFYLEDNVLEIKLNQPKDKDISKTLFDEGSNSEVYLNGKKLDNTNTFKDNIVNDNLVQKIRNNNFFYLLVYRWIGIDGFINVELKDDRNLSTFIRALKEKYIIGDPTFYEKEFFIIPDKNSYNQVFVPGFLAFFNYSNIDTVFYLSAILLVFLILGNEYLIVKLFYQYNLFKGIISFIIVWRIIHFGISPINTLKYFLLIIITVVSIKMLMVVFEKFLKKNYQ